MRKSTKYFLLACLMFLLGLFEGVSGFVLWLILPQAGGYRGGRGAATQAAFLWSRNTWIDLHDWIAVALLVVVVLHIILHWNWIVRMIKTCCRPAKRQN